MVPSSSLHSFTSCSVVDRWLTKPSLEALQKMFAHNKQLSRKISSDSFTILGLWVLGLAVSNINESQLQTYESKTLFLMTILQYLCIPGLTEIKTNAQKMQDAQVTKSLNILNFLTNKADSFFAGEAIFSNDELDSQSGSFLPGTEYFFQ